MPRPDWAAIKLAFINGTETYAQIAERFSVASAAARKRGNREGWTNERHQKSHEVTAKAQAKIEKTRAQEISEWNAGDIKIAKAIRAQIARHLTGANEAQKVLAADELRTLAAANEAAQRIARTALGIAKENPPDGSDAPGPVMVSIERVSARRKEVTDDGEVALPPSPE